MADINTEPDATPQVVFRPGKKRKAYRQRLEEPESTTTSNGATPAETDPATSSSAFATPTETDRDEAGLSVAEALRLRNLRKHKHGGVGFRAGPSGLGDDRAGSEENTEQGLVLHGNADAQQGAEAAVIGGISQRFAPQTGLVGDLVNRHMEEYVESELARRKRHAEEAAAQQQQLLDQQQMLEDGTTSAGDGQLGGPTPGPQGDAQRALLGRLFEVDLGDEARMRNVEMTERARRRLQGQIDEEEQDESKGGLQKVRLGRDGKPMRSRNRRGSDDIKRDQLVEEFLSENRLDMYDTQQEQPADVASFEDEDLAADDRIADQFRREFMEAMAQRTRRRRTARPANKASTAPREEILRGPKLGGSRNERSAMRDILLKEQVAKKQRR